MVSFVFFLAWAEAAVTAIDDNNSWWHKNPVLWLIFLNTIFALVPLANVKSVAKSIIFFWLCYFFVDASLLGFPLFRPGQLNNNSLKTLPSINITHLRHSRSMHNHLSAMPLNTYRRRHAQHGIAQHSPTKQHHRDDRYAPPNPIFCSLFSDPLAMVQQQVVVSFRALVYFGTHIVSKDDPGPMPIPVPVWEWSTVKIQIQYDQVQTQTK